MKVILAVLVFLSSFFTGSKDMSVRGIILPHHDLAKEIFHTSLTKVKDYQTPSTIVIFGTNHYFPDGPTFTTLNDVEDKYSFKNVLVNDLRLANEHSIQTLKPYLKEYFPKAEIIPIIISSKYDMNEIYDLTQFLIKVLPKDTLYIASVDFSHNSTIEVGLEKNSESIQAISNFDYQKVLDYHDDHMDSPVAITVFMKTMEKLNARKWETWISSHGGLITKNPLLNGTSYVVGVFR